jgi:carbamoyltransferase
MNILGIADNHDSGAALLIDGEIVSAINQERIDREKNSSAFPWGAIDGVLAEGKLRPRDIDTIVVGTSYTPSAFLRMMPRFHQKRKHEGQFSKSLHGYMVYQSLLRRSGFDIIEQRTSQWVFKKKFKERRFTHPTIVLVDHHEAHAQGAYRTQERDQCLILTLDAMGDGCSASVWMGKGGRLTKLWDQSGLAAINLFYSRITELLGFRPLRHEGKITGLSARAKPDSTLLSAFRKHVSFRNGRFTRMPIFRAAHPDDPLWKQVCATDRDVVAATAQCVLEEVTCAYITHWIRRSECGDIALAGGVFANVLLNQKIAMLSEVTSMWVLPHMGDGGLALGGALGYAKTRPKAIENIYWGPQHTSIDTLRAIQRHKSKVLRNDIIVEAARILGNGGIIARSSGGMEWGPRALGNRSVLASVSDPNINTVLNQKLKRSEFMPFAPMVRTEDARRYFKNIEAYGRCPRFMTTCVDVTEVFRTDAPAAVHIDGTARPQIVHRESQPEIHALLTAMYEQTGIGVLINTSFNLHEEPIVCTPDESIRAAKEANLDALWISDQLLLFL